MALTEETKRERAKVKELSLEKKLEHYIHYYKKPALIFGIIAIMIISTIQILVSQKETVFNGVFINSLANNEVNELKIEFDEFLDFDIERCETIFDTTVIISDDIQDEGVVISQQKLAAMISMQDVDVIATNIEAFVGLAYGDYFVDLNTVFSPEELEIYKDDIFYIDLELQREIDYILDNLDIIDTETYQFEEKDPSKPELMIEPIPVGIMFDTSTKLGSEYRFFTNDTVIGIVINSKRKDTAIDFINMALQIK